MEARLIAFLERLLGEAVDPNGRVAVSSTQRAQIVAWLNSNGVAADFKRFKANLMSVAEMLAGGATDSPAPAIKAVIPALRTVRPVANGAGPLGLGVDLQARTSMPEASDYRTDPFYARNFTARELAHCLQKADPLESLTGLWAAKEAVFKAGAAIPAKAGEFIDIEIITNEDGAPNYPGCLVSISHEAGMAVAVCVRLS